MKAVFLPVDLVIMQVMKQKRLHDCSVNYEIQRMHLEVLKKAIGILGK